MMFYEMKNIIKKKCIPPLQPEFDLMNERYNDDTPFGIAQKLFVPRPFHPAVADSYIDDIVTTMLDKADWVARVQNVAPLAVYTVFRPVDTTNPLPRADSASKTNLHGEGTLDEAKVVIGWLINTKKSESSSQLRKPQIGPKTSAKS